MSAITKSEMISRRKALSLGRVLINRGTPFDVRYAPDSGAKADIAGLPRWAISRSHATAEFASIRRRFPTLVSGWKTGPA
jgi:hypothetical protein